MALKNVVSPLFWPKIVWLLSVLFKLGPLTWDQISKNFFCFDIWPKFLLFFYCYHYDHVLRRIRLFKALVIERDVKVEWRLLELLVIKGVPSKAQNLRHFSIHVLVGSEKTRA